MMVRFSNRFYLKLSCAWIASLIFIAAALADDSLTGREVMEKSFELHELYPHIFERQTLILMDNTGERNVRKIRRFSRIEEDATLKYLLVIDYPIEVRGVGLLAIKPSDEAGKSGVYLPAFGEELKSNAGESRGNAFLDTDFTIEDLTPESIEDYLYKRVDDQRIDKVNYYIVEALPANKEIERATGYSYRRHFLRKDNLFLARTDFYDRRGRFLKRQTSHDLKEVSEGMWRANMVLMEDHKRSHKSLIKVNQRVFSQDYVPAEVFSEEWLRQNAKIKLIDKNAFLEEQETENDNLEGVDEVLQKAAEGNSDVTVK